MFHLQWPLVHHCWHVESSKGRMHFLEEYISTCCTQEGFSRNILIKNIFFIYFFPGGKHHYCAGDFSSASHPKEHAGTEPPRCRKISNQLQTAQLSHHLPAAAFVLNLGRALGCW